jgi:hypothetical protein
MTPRIIRIAPNRAGRGGALKDDDDNDPALTLSATTLPSLTCNRTLMLSSGNRSTVLTVPPERPAINGAMAFCENIDDDDDVEETAASVDVAKAVGGDIVGEVDAETTMLEFKSL